MKKIQLGGHLKNSKIKGYALVDDEDYDWLNQWKWKIDSKNYAIRCHKRKYISMHRLILKQCKELIIDHINRNTLDNQKHNLRIVTKSQNAMNKKNQAGSLSRFKGVTRHKYSKKWQAQIMKNGKSKHLGMFNSEIDAALAYNNAAKEIFGEFALINNLPLAC
jgi:hypothetical protein